MENERNLITGTTMSKRDDSQELNLLTGTFQPVKDKSDVCKSDSLLWPSISKRSDGSESEDDEEFEKIIPIFPVEKKGDEQIVAGVVYEPDEVDTQGDSANADEIRKAAYDFMQNVQTFKVMHKGKAAKVKVLESYIAPQDMTIGKKKVKKGSWVLVTRVLDKKLWTDIKAGNLTGYSMAGSAKTES